MPLYEVIEDKEFPKARIFPRAIDFQHWQQDWTGTNHLSRIIFKNIPDVFPCACIIEYKDFGAYLFEVYFKVFPIGIEVKAKNVPRPGKYSMLVLPTLDVVTLDNVKLAMFDTENPTETQIANAWVSEKTLAESLGG